MNIATMKKLEQLYKRISRPIENLLFPVILLLWPLIKVNQGIDITDSTYSLGNYLFCDRLSGPWVLMTYVSNLFGSLLVRLPGGNTLLGANIYTGLIISATALMCYYTLRRELTAPVVFLGEFISIGLCWIPSGILYNYLTYFFFNLATILIYFAIKKEKRLYYSLAGFFLGLNVFVRLPNLAEMALIAVVWIGVCITQKKIRSKDKKTGKVLAKVTGSCVVGYFIGLAIPAAVMDIQKGQYAITEMLSGIGSVSGSNEEYTLASMIIRTINAYAHSIKWLFMISACIFAGTLMMAVIKSHTILKWMGRIIYLGIIVMMFRFFWGRGMFSFRYYEDYTSIYEWAMIVLFLTWICVITVLIKKNYNILLKTYASMVMMILIITPLGSNNYTMQNINNMFLVLPFVIYIIGGWLYKGVHRIRLEGVLYGCNFPWMSTVIAVLAIFFIQTVGFHIGFIFCDGMDGTPRDGQTAGIECTEGMHTTADNAQTLSELYEAVTLDDNTDSVIYWGDCPGLPYILRIPAAISTSWPDLESYPSQRFKSDLDDIAMSGETLSNVAVIVCKTPISTGEDLASKKEILDEFIKSNSYSIIFENDRYVLYRR